LNEIQSRENEAVAALRRLRAAAPQNGAANPEPERATPPPKVSPQGTPPVAKSEGPAPEAKPPTGDDAANFIEIDPAARVRVKASGEFRDVSFQDLRDSFASQAELSRLANVLVSKNKEIDGRRAEYDAALGKVQQLMDRLRGAPPAPELLNQDPAEYIRQKEMYEQRVNALNTLDGEKSKISAEKTAEQTAAFQAYAQGEYAKILEKLPTFENDKGKILDYCLSLGAGEDQIRGVHPHWLYVMAHKAMSYDALEAQRPAVTARLREAPPMTRPGASNPQDGNRDYNELLARFNDPRTKPSERERLVVQMKRARASQQPSR
jgi:hypothetical protein